MNNLTLKSLPEAYKSMIDQIKDTTVMKLYSNFNYFFFQVSNNGTNEANNKNEDGLELFLLSYLRLSKFITYYISSIRPSSEILDLDANKSKNNDEQEIINVIICVEKECLIIEQARLSSINKIINKINEEKSYIVNAE